MKISIKIKRGKSVKLIFTSIFANLFGDIKAEEIFIIDRLQGRPDNSVIIVDSQQWRLIYEVIIIYGWAVDCCISRQDHCESFAMVHLKLVTCRCLSVGGLVWLNPQNHLCDQSRQRISCEHLIHISDTSWECERVRGDTAQSSSVRRAVVISHIWTRSWGEHVHM